MPAAAPPELQRPHGHRAQAREGVEDELPGLGVLLDRAVRDVIIGNASGEACAEETCSFLFGCSKKVGGSGDELNEGRLTTSLSNVNTTSQAQQTDNPFLALLFGPQQSAGPSDSELAERIALYKAVESVPDADAIIVPRKSIKVTVSDDLFSGGKKSCVRVVGKAVRLKTDAEMAGATAALTPPPAPAAPAAP